jgi:hypothetical protein
MKCPECGAKILSKHYDPDFEMYECPRCGGLHTVAEIEEARGQDPVRADVSSGNGRADLAGRRPGTAVVAKAKKRKTEIVEEESLSDEQLLDKDSERIVAQVTKSGERQPQHRDDAGTGAVVTAWGAEIQDVYHELGGRIDQANAEDKALTLWRELAIQTGLQAREQSVPFLACKRHS